MLVKIGTTDITRHIIAESYAVNEEDVYNEWTDANKVTHRDVVRQKIAGAFTLKFNTEEEYSSFVNLIKTSRIAGCVLPMTVYVVNADENRETELIYSFQPRVAKSLPRGKTYQSFDFEVEQP